MLAPVPSAHAPASPTAVDTGVGEVGEAQCRW